MLSRNLNVHTLFVLSWLSPIILIASASTQNSAQINASTKDCPSPALIHRPFCFFRASPSNPSSSISFASNPRGFSSRFSAQPVTMSRRNYVQWVGNLLDDNSITFPDGVEWSVGPKISEKCSIFEGHRWGTERDTSEAQAVYHCHQTTGPSVGREAIMKIRLQYVTFLCSSLFV